jgi:hypothetical protein
VKAAERLEAFGVWPVMTTIDIRQEPASRATLQDVRRTLADAFRRRRDELVFYVFRQIGTLRARWLLHRLAEGLPDEAENRDRKRVAAETATALDQARIRDPELDEKTVKP